MKLNCTVSLSNWQAADQPWSKDRGSKSILTLGEEDKEGFLFLRMHKDSILKKYKVTKNVDKVFTRFVNEGKATIRLQRPPFDLIIQAKREELMTFLRALKSLLSNTGLPQFQKTTSVHSEKKLPPPPRTKLVISSPGEIPAAGYPRTLQTLEIKAGLHSLTPQILRLQNLVSLNLSGNKLSSLPEEINLLPNLINLDLSSNQFGHCRDWKWLGSLSSHLVSLNLSNNQLLFLPRLMSRLRRLKKLGVDNNLLSEVPPSLCYLPNLQDLLLQSNKIKYLPARLLRGAIQLLDLSGNSFITWDSAFDTLSAESTSLVETKTLVDLAAVAVLRSKVLPTEKDIPHTLLSYLEDACYCTCREPSFPPKPSFYSRVPARSLASHVIYDMESSLIPLAFRYCEKCSIASSRVS